jgi:hypothetical protein
MPALLRVFLLVVAGTIPVFIAAYLESKRRPEKSEGPEPGQLTDAYRGNTIDLNA